MCITLLFLKTKTTTKNTLELNFTFYITYISFADAGSGLFSGAQTSNCTLKSLLCILVYIRCYDTFPNILKQHNRQKYKNTSTPLTKENMKYLHSSLLFSEGRGTAYSALAFKSGSVNACWIPEELHLNSFTCDWLWRQLRNCNSTQRPLTLSWFCTTLWLASAAFASKTNLYLLQIHKNTLNT